MKHFIIGKGKVGKTLLSSLKACGEELGRDIHRSDVIWLTVPDSVIKKKVKEIESSLAEKHILVHCSGFFPASIMKNGKTNKLVSLHPAFSFSKPLDIFPEGIFWTFEGYGFVFGIFSDLIQKWKGKVKRISEKQKELYHIACVFASNFPIVSLLIAEKLFEKSGIEFEDIKKGLVHPVCEKVIGNSRLVDVLTGPAKRKDMETILKEIEVLKEKDFEISEIYRLLSNFVLKNI